MKQLIALLVLLLAAPMALAQTPQYKIKPGDRLQIEVLEDSSLNRTVLVAPDGQITFPLAGSIRAGGMSTSEVMNSLAANLAPNFANKPNVFVSLNAVGDAPASSGGSRAAARTIDVYLMGEVAQPGKISVAPGTTLIQLFAEMGGFSKFAATKRVQLRRTPKGGAAQIYTFNYQAMERGAAAGGNTTVADGDVIIVPQRRLFE